MALLDMSNHKDIQIYQRAYALSLEIYRETKKFPKEELYGITSQMRKASTSICANIAEGCGRQINSDAEFKRFLVIAKGSCYEMFVWLDYCHDLEFLSSEMRNQWFQEYTELSKMLHSFINNLDKNK